MSELFQSAPDRGERFLLREWVGHLCLFTPKQFRDSVPMPNGDADVIEGDVVVLTAQPVATFTNTWVLGKYVVPRLREAIGGVPVLARIEIVPGSEKRDRPAHQLAAFSPQDAQFAEQYIRSQPAVQPAQQYGAPVPLPNSQPQGYGAPSPQDQQWATQQVYAPTDPGYVNTPSVPAPAPQQPAVAPVTPPASVPAPALAPSPQPAAQAQSASVLELTAEQLEQMPEETKKLLLGAAYKPPAGA